MVAKEKPLHSGHRARLKGRFIDSPASLADYELLELLLFMAIPRRDTKPLAKTLLKKFAGIENVFAAPAEDLGAVDGMTESAAIALKSVEAAAKRLLQVTATRAPILSSWKHLLDYCTAQMAREKTEQFRVIYLNRRNMVIADEIHQTGTVDQSAVYPREIVARALGVGATAIILVHNHPSGDPTPSDADVTLTHDLIRAFEPLGVVVHDHLIIAKTGHTSFKKLGLI